MDNVADGTENFFVFSRAERRTYRMPFSQGENSKLILHRQRIVWCLALITAGLDVSDAELEVARTHAHADSLATIVYTSG
ncbi:MAG: hypothetical protein ACFNLR_04905, partial [Prevotella denticola]